MPQNAYDSGYVDFVMSPENIAKELARLVTSPYTILPSDKIEEKHNQDLDSNTGVLKTILLRVKAKPELTFFFIISPPPFTDVCSEGLS